jgi:pimeloyl-ACP methyl ester carboxylesterase
MMSVSARVRWLLLLALGVAVPLVIGLAAARAGRFARVDRGPPLARVELHLVPDAYVRPHVLLMTLGGPTYCNLLLPLAEYLNASRLCPDYGRNGQKLGANREARVEDWGDPAYLRYVAKLPRQLRARGVKVAKLVLVGVSYSGYANAQLLATHPELHADALVMIDSFFDLPSRYRALPATHETHAEIEKVLGGSLAQKPGDYAARSPSNHLDGLASAIRHGTRLIVIWSIAQAERIEFNRATCAETADAKWLSELATLLGRPLVGYVSRMKHADALRNWGEHLLALAGVGPTFKTPLPAHAFTFTPRQTPTRGSYCH